MTANIEILYSSLSTGFDLLKTSIYSLIKSQNTSHYNITIAHIDINDWQQNQIRGIVHLKQGNNIRFVDCNKWVSQYKLRDIFKSDNDPLHIAWPCTMYFYFLSPLFYQNHNQKIIYLDIDTIVKKDLGVYIMQPTNGATFTGVKEYTLIHWFNEQNRLFRLNKLDEAIKNQKFYVYPNFLTKETNKFVKYINSGSMLIDLTQLSKVNIQELFEYTRRKNLADQDVVGLCFEKQTNNLDLSYCYCLHFFMDYWFSDNFGKKASIYKEMAISKNESMQLLEKATVIHYTARPNKPSAYWNYDLKRKFMDKIGIENYNFALLDFVNAQKTNKLNSLSQQEKNDLGLVAYDFQNSVVNQSKETDVYKKTFLYYGLIWDEMNKVMRF